jgi:hypothetical protein
MPQLNFYFYIMNVGNEDYKDRFAEVVGLVKYPEMDQFYNIFQHHVKHVLQDYGDLKIEENTMPEIYKEMLSESEKAGYKFPAFVDNTKVVYNIIFDRWYQKLNILLVEHIQGQRELSENQLALLQQHFKIQIEGFMSWIEDAQPEFKFSEKYIRSKLKEILSQIFSQIQAKNEHKA